MKFKRRITTPRVSTWTEGDGSIAYRYTKPKARTLLRHQAAAARLAGPVLLAFLQTDLGGPGDAGEEGSRGLGRILKQLENPATQAAMLDAFVSHVGNLDGEELFDLCWGLCEGSLGVADPEEVDAGGVEVYEYAETPEEFEALFADSFEMVGLALRVIRICYTPFSLARGMSGNTASAKKGSPS